jgi:hypothetical protein
MLPTPPFQYLTSPFSTGLLVLQELEVGGHERDIMWRKMSQQIEAFWTGTGKKRRQKWMVRRERMCTDPCSLLQNGNLDSPISFLRMCILTPDLFPKMEVLSIPPVF